MTPGSPLTVGRVFREAAEAVPDVAAVHLGGASWTFGDLQARADRFRAGLAAAGCSPGDVVGVHVDLHLDLMALFVALAQSGAVFLPFDPAVAPEHRPASPLDLLVVDDAHSSAAPDAVPTVALADLGVEDPPPPVPLVAEDAPQSAFFTSGTTGLPKVVALSNRTQWLRSTAGPLVDPRGTTVCMFPFFHMAGWLVALQCWQARAAVVLVHAADAESLLGAVAEHRAERLYAIPAVWRRVLDADPRGERGASLRYIDTGTSAAPPELLAELAARYPHARQRVFYGSTEAGPVLMLDGADVERHPGAVGRPLPGVEVRRADDGELLVRGVHTFEGYLDGTPGVDAAGWYSTGDLVECSDGVWSITGRSRQVIRTGGESLSPREVEEVLEAVEGAHDVVVLGLPDPQWGEIVVAVLERDPAAAAGDLVARARERATELLVPAKRPRRYEVVSALPRTSATGQVRRAELTERLVAGIPLEGEST